ncbi:tumor necrosis factor receptor superfamily member 25-like isoform 2-T2 [Glossophaga mutica]
MPWWLRGLLLLSAAVAVVPRESPCKSDQYELHGLCCDLCPAGSHVSRVCDVDRVTECSPCEPGSFTAHRNRETECLLCAKCRDDQEVVSDCTQDSNRRCQCTTGSFYCDSEDCVEACHPCSRCDGPTLETCNATRDTVCATEGEPGPGGSASSSIWAVVGPIIAATIVAAAIIAVAFYRKRPAVPVPQLVVRWLKHESRDPGDPRGPQHKVILPLGEVESGLPAPGTDSTPLLGQQGAAVVPSKDPDGGLELQAVEATGGGPAPEQAPHTQATVAPGDPDRDQDQAGTAAPLHVLEQQYERKYVLKDRSPEATNRIYFEFGQEVPKRSWRMFMRLAGLEENDIVICEHENPGNLAEQQHRMLLRWQSRLGRAASPFRLLAALRRMGLRECLENITNKLVAEDILGSKDAEPPN